MPPPLSAILSVIVQFLTVSSLSESKYIAPPESNDRHPEMKTLSIFSSLFTQFIALPLEVGQEFPHLPLGEGGSQGRQAHLYHGFVGEAEHHQVGAPTAVLGEHQPGNRADDHGECQQGLVEPGYLEAFLVGHVLQVDSRR